VNRLHLLTAVPPTYPALAKTQRIEGLCASMPWWIQRQDFRDEGNVRAGAVASGGHGRAASVEYQPATLDGKAVPMHLTVTVQFRLQ